MKKFIFALCLSLGTMAGFAQLDTTSFPEQRGELLQVIHETGPGKEKSCGDWVAVGPKGDLSFSRQQWIEAQKKQKVVFKSMRLVPGSEIVRVYDKTCGVVNFLLEVSLVVAGKDLTIKVRRLEVYHHTAAGWCMVAGQGTEVDESVFPVNETVKP
ncbi:MAG: nuclear transport factor 2 family protein [Chitinophagaceae bacterium]|nr:MAG: nuclear transport factor 2 family protein [Chitinophagaceae bacterium]